MTSSNPKYLSKSLPPKTITLGVVASTYEFWRAINIQSITPRQTIERSRQLFLLNLDGYEVGTFSLQRNSVNAYQGVHVQLCKLCHLQLQWCYLHSLGIWVKVSGVKWALGFLIPSPTPSMSLHRQSILSWTHTLQDLYNSIWVCILK